MALLRVLGTVIRCIFSKNCAGYGIGGCLTIKRGILLVGACSGGSKGEDSSNCHRLRLTQKAGCKNKAFLPEHYFYTSVSISIGILLHGERNGPGRAEREFV